MNTEVQGSKQHEKDGDTFDLAAVEPGKTVIMGRESAGGNGGQAVGDGIERLHAKQPVGKRTGGGKRKIDQPQRPRCTRQPRGHFLFFHRTWRFRPIQLHAADTQHGQHSDTQHDQAHAPHPLQFLAEKQHGAR